MNKISVRIVSIVLVLCVIISFASCNRLSSPRDIDHSGNPIFSYCGKDMVVPDVNELVSEIDAAVKNASEKEVYALTNAFFSQLYQIQNQYLAAVMEYNIHFYDEEETWFDNYMHMNSLYNEWNAASYTLYALFADTRYEDVFMAGLSEQEREDLVADSDEYDEEYLSLMASYEDLVNQYYEIDPEAEDATEKVAEIYALVASVNNKIAAKFGFNDYLTYAYDSIYAREFTPEDTEQLVKQAVTFLLPLLEENKSVNDQTINVRLYRELEKFYYDSALEGEGKEALDSYFESLGGELNRSYKLFHQYDLYYAASDPSLAYGIAYTDYSVLHSLPICYFGPAYQSRMTVVHELGHFMRAYLTQNGYQSYDMAELNSQANEVLYLAFLKSCSDEEFYRYVLTEELRTRVAYVVEDLLINSFEYAVYTAAEKTAITSEDVLRIFMETCERFGGYDYLCEILGYDVNLYWQYMVITQPGYYISYCVSALSALELFVIAEEDYQKAVDIYRLIETDPAETLPDMLRNVGLSDPFDEVTFGNIAGSVKNILWKNSW